MRDRGGREMDRALDTRRGQKDERADTRISRPARGRYDQGIHF